jgi:sec-independent protein translocase protein TatC
MTMIDHLTELAKRLKVVVAALLVASSIGFLPIDPRGFLDPINHYQPIVSIMMLKIRHDFLPSGATLIASGLVDTIFVYTYLTLLIGVALSSPIIAYELYAFIRPALYQHERKHLLGFAGSFVGLFAVGLVMAYFLIIPITFKILVWFITAGGAVPFIAIGDFYNWVFVLMLLSGIFYTIPAFIVLLVQFGIMGTEYLSGRRRIMIYVALLVSLWIFAPDPTPITGMIIMIPFTIIFEGASVVANRIGKGRRKNLATTDGTSEPRRERLPLLPRTKPVFTKCRFCGGLVSTPGGFCPDCGKSQI